MGRKVISSKAFSKARTSIRRSIPKTFVSFAGKRSLKTESGRSSVTGSIKRKRWNAFYFNGRAMFGNRIFQKSCTLFCEVTFISCEVPFKLWEKSSSSVQEDHAEVKALTKIADMENVFGGAGEVEMLLSYSPCARCAAAIINFLKARPLLEITLAFSAIYRHDEKEHRQSLRLLNCEPGVTLRVFNENDWRRLAKETDMPFHFNLKRITEDSYWDYIFQMILRGSDPPRSLQPPSPINPSHPVLPSSTSQPSHQIYSSGPIFPFDTSQSSQQAHPSGLVLPSSTSQLPPQIHSNVPFLPFSTSQLSHPIHSSGPFLPSSPSQSSHQINPSDPVHSSNSSQKPHPVHTRRPALPSRISQSFPVRPNRPVLPSSTSQQSHRVNLPEIQSRGIHLPVNQIDSVLPFGTAQSFHPVHATHAVPPSRTFCSGSPVPPNRSTSSFRQFCPSVLCTHPEDDGTDSATPWERCAQLMASKKLIFFLAFVLFLVLLTVILAVTLS